MVRKCLPGLPPVRVWAPRIAFERVSRKEERECKAKQAPKRNFSICTARRLWGSLAAGGASLLCSLPATFTPRQEMARIVFERVSREEEREREAQRRALEAKARFKTVLETQMKENARRRCVCTVCVHGWRQGSMACRRQWPWEAKAHFRRR